jgi:DNA-binding response OmpR family regulator
LLPEEAPRPSDAGALRILVVDADARAREGIRDTLRGEGHAVVTAGSAAAAVEYLGTGLAVDVVLTTSLRDASDASLATVVKERWPSLVVGVLRDADERSGEPAADFVLAKPVDPGALAAALAEHARPRPRWTEDRGAGPGLPWRPS